MLWYVVVTLEQHEVAKLNTLIIGDILSSFSVSYTPYVSVTIMNPPVLVII